MIGKYDIRFFNQREINIDNENSIHSFDLKCRLKITENSKVFYNTLINSKCINFDQNNFVTLLAAFLIFFEENYAILSKVISEYKSNMEKDGRYSDVEKINKYFLYIEKDEKNIDKPTEYNFNFFPNSRDFLMKVVSSIAKYRQASDKKDYNFVDFTLQEVFINEDDIVMENNSCKISLNSSMIMKLLHYFIPEIKRINWKIFEENNWNIEEYAKRLSYIASQYVNAIKDHTDVYLIDIASRSNTNKMEEKLGLKDKLIESMQKKLFLANAGEEEYAAELLNKIDIFNMTKAENKKIFSELASIYQKFTKSRRRTIEKAVANIKNYLDSDCTNNDLIGVHFELVKNIPCESKKKNGNSDEEIEEIEEIEKVD